MSGSQTADSPEANLMRSWLEGWEKKDVNHLANLMHEDHRRITYPRSVGKPEQTKEEYLKNTGELLSLWTGDLDVSCTFGCHSISPLLNPLVDAHPFHRKRTWDGCGSRSYRKLPDPHRVSNVVPAR